MSKHYIILNLYQVQEIHKKLYCDIVILIIAKYNFVRIWLKPNHLRLNVRR